MRKTKDKKGMRKAKGMRKTKGKKGGLFGNRIASMFSKNMKQQDYCCKSSFGETSGSIIGYNCSKEDCKSNPDLFRCFDNKEKHLDGDKYQRKTLMDRRIYDKDYNDTITEVNNDNQNSRCEFVSSNSGKVLKTLGFGANALGTVLKTALLMDRPNTGPSIPQVYNVTLKQKSEEEGEETKKNEANINKLKIEVEQARKEMEAKPGDPNLKIKYHQICDEILKYEIRNLTAISEGYDKEIKNVNEFIWNNRGNTEENKIKTIPARLRVIDIEIKNYENKIAINTKQMESLEHKYEIVKADPNYTNNPHKADTWHSDSKKKYMKELSVIQNALDFQKRVKTSLETDGGSSKNKKTKKTHKKK